MCSANFQSMMGKLGKLDLAGRVSDYTDARDPLMKKLGYSGIFNPAEEIKHKIAGTKSSTTVKAEATGLKIAGGQRDAAYRRLLATSQPGHVTAIAARKARGG